MWQKFSKEETLDLGTITGFDVEKFVKTSERVDGKQLKLKIGAKEFNNYYKHLKNLYNKRVSMDDIVDDQHRQDLHNEAAESTFRNSFSKDVLKYYKNGGEVLEGLNYRIRAMINDEVAEMMKYSVMAKYKKWITIKAYDLENGSLEQENIGEVDVNSFRTDKPGEGSDQYFSFKRNRSKNDTGEKNDDKSPVLTEEDSVRKESMPAVDDYGNSRKI